MKRIIALAVATLAVNSMMATAADVPVPTSNKLPAEKNAYTLWTNTASQMELPKDKVFEDAYYAATELHPNMPTGEGRQKLEAWINSKKDPLLMVSKGIALGEFQFSDFCVESRLAAFRNIARVKIILARYDVERSEYKEAARECHEVLRMGQLICGGNGAVIDYLTGITIQIIGLNGTQWFCGTDKIPLDILRQTLKDLPPPKMQDHDLAQTYHAEHTQVFLPTIRHMEKKASESSDDLCRLPAYFKADETIRMNSDFVTRFASNALSSWVKRDTRIEADIRLLAPMKSLTNENTLEDFMLNISAKTKDASDQLKQMGKTQTNVVGRMFVMQFDRAIGQAYELSVRIRTMVNLTRAFIALRILERETGELPESLEAIRSHSLTSDLPEDLFSGKPVLYSREKRIVWSVGPDGKDDGGDEKKDLVVKLPDSLKSGQAKQTKDGGVAVKP